MTTARQLYDAAIAAKLAMPGLMLEDRPLHDSSLLVYADFSVSEYVGKWRVASLADVECAVMDALAGRISTIAFARIPADSPGVGNTEPLWCVSGCYFDMERKVPRTLTTLEPTRAAALLAACEALAKEAK